MVPLKRFHARPQATFSSSCYVASKQGALSSPSGLDNNSLLREYPIKLLSIHASFPAVHGHSPLAPVLSPSDQDDELAELIAKPQPLRCVGNGTWSLSPGIYNSLHPCSDQLAAAIC